MSIQDSLAKILAATREKALRALIEANNANFQEGQYPVFLRIANEAARQSSLSEHAMSLVAQVVKAARVMPGQSPENQIQFSSFVADLQVTNEAQILAYTVLFGEVQGCAMFTPEIQLLYLKRLIALFDVSKLAVTTRATLLRTLQSFVKMVVVEDRYSGLIPQYFSACVSGEKEFRFQQLLVPALNPILALDVVYSLYTDLELGAEAKQRVVPMVESVLQMAQETQLSLQKAFFQDLSKQQLAADESLFSTVKALQDVKGNAQLVCSYYFCYARLFSLAEQLPQIHQRMLAAMALQIQGQDLYKPELSALLYITMLVYVNTPQQALPCAHSLTRIVQKITQDQKIFNTASMAKAETFSFQFMQADAGLDATALVDLSPMRISALFNYFDQNVLLTVLALELLSGIVTNFEKGQFELGDDREQVYALFSGVFKHLILTFDSDGCRERFLGYATRYICCLETQEHTAAVAQDLTDFLLQFPLQLLQQPLGQLLKKPVKSVPAQAYFFQGLLIRSLPQFARARADQISHFHCINLQFLLNMATSTNLLPAGNVEFEDFLHILQNISSAKIQSSGPQTAFMTQLSELYGIFQDARSVQIKSYDSYLQSLMVLTQHFQGLLFELLVLILQNELFQESFKAEQQQVFRLTCTEEFQKLVWRLLRNPKYYQYVQTMMGMIVRSQVSIACQKEVPAVLQGFLEFDFMATLRQIETQPPNLEQFGLALVVLKYGLDAQEGLGAKAKLYFMQEMECLLDLYTPFSQLLTTQYISVLQQMLRQMAGVELPEDLQEKLSENALEIWRNQQAHEVQSAKSRQEIHNTILCAVQSTDKPKIVLHCFGALYDLMRDKRAVVFDYVELYRRLLEESHGFKCIVQETLTPWQVVWLFICSGLVCLAALLMQLNKANNQKRDLILEASRNLLHSFHEGIAATFIETSFQSLYLVNELVNITLKFNDPVFTSLMYGEILSLFSSKTICESCFVLPVSEEIAEREQSGTDFENLQLEKKEIVHGKELLAQVFALGVNSSYEDHLQQIPNVLALLVRLHDSYPEYKAACIDSVLEQFKLYETLEQKQYDESYLLDAVIPVATGSPLRCEESFNWLVLLGAQLNPGQQRETSQRLIPELFQLVFTSTNLTNCAHLLWVVYDQIMQLPNDVAKYEILAQMIKQFTDGYYFVKASPYLNELVFCVLCILGKQLPQAEQIEYLRSMAQFIQQHQTREAMVIKIYLLKTIQSLGLFERLHEQAAQLIKQIMIQLLPNISGSGSFSARVMLFCEYGGEDAAIATFIKAHSELQLRSGSRPELPGGISMESQALCTTIMNDTLNLLSAQQQLMKQFTIDLFRNSTQNYIVERQLMGSCPVENGGNFRKFVALFLDFEDVLRFVYNDAIQLFMKCPELAELGITYFERLGKVAGLLE